VQNNIELAPSMIVMVEQKELSHRVPSASTSTTTPLSSITFKGAEDAKVMQIDADDPMKPIQIGASLNPK
jgi:hypothetical protein